MAGGAVLRFLALACAAATPAGARTLTFSCEISGRFGPEQIRVVTGDGQATSVFFQDREMPVAMESTAPKGWPPLITVFGPLGQGGWSASSLEKSRSYLLQLNLSSDEIHLTSHFMDLDRTTGSERWVRTVDRHKGACTRSLAD